MFYTLNGETGDVLGRMVVEVPAPVDPFVVNPEDGVLYLTIPAEASVLAVDVKEVVRR